MSYFAALWKARTLEKHRLEYESVKFKALLQSKASPERSTKWHLYGAETRQVYGQFKKLFQQNKCGSEQPLPNLILKSFVGFLGGVVLTYLCFICFVYQLSISLVHATIMSSIIGLLLTLGLAFSNRLRCLVFLLIPQFFSRIGRYTLTCYALILILTGPATNTLRNSEVLTESMACSQEQIKTNVRHLSDSMKQPFHAMKDSVRLMLNKFDRVSGNMKDILLKIERMVISVADVIQSSHSWLVSVVNICNRKLGTPYNHCMNILKKGIPDCKSILGSKLFWCNVTNVEAACQDIKSHKEICVVDDFARGSFAATIQRKWRSFTKRVKTMFFVNIQVHHKYTVSNASRSASQVAAGIVTEIRNRADPLITWLSWSSCVTSLFLLLIIFRAKYYQHMYETRSRFDNRYVTQELYEIDLKRFQEGRDTILPLNRRERTKYIPTTSFRLIATEKVFMSRSAVFMMITTFKLMIHIIADYSLFWVLTTIEHHGRLQTQIPPGPSDAGVKITGTGFAAELLKSIFNILTIPLQTPMTSPTACLPNPHPPDFQRYTQIGVIIVILWLLALFEPYGLRLRHVIMGHHRPERAKARANWLYNHILRTRGSFMKLARRKLHREYKYSGYEHLTFRHWLDSRLPCWCLRYLLGTVPKETRCLLCDTTEKVKDVNTHLTRCETPKCPGIFCNSCFNDIGKLCTICLSPADYGDYSDISLEKGSSDDDSDDTFNSYECKDDSSKDYFNIKIPNGKLSDIKRTNQNRQRNLHVGYKKSSSFSEKGPLLLPQYDQSKDKTAVKKATDLTLLEFSNCSLRKLERGYAILPEKIYTRKHNITKRDTTSLIKLFALCQNLSRDKFRKPRRKCYQIRRKSWTSKSRFLSSIYSILKNCFKLKKSCIYAYKLNATRRKSLPKWTCLTKPIYAVQAVMRKRINNKIALKNKRTNIDFTIILNKDNRHTIQLGQQQATSTKINLQETNKNELHNKRAQKCSKDVDMPKHKTKSKNHYKYTKPLFVAFSTCFKLNNKYVSSTDLNSSNQSKHGSKNHKRNFKRRKKKENNKIYIKRQNEISRNYRISAYLQDQSWVKGSLHRDSLKSRIRKECALNQLARCRMYAASNKEREADLLNKIKDTICVKTRVCTCPKGVCICKNNQEVHIDDTKKPISKEMKKGCSKCECHYDCKKIAKKEKSAVGSKTKKFVDWCRGNKKNCCKIQNVNREEDASPSYWKPSELIEVHQYENNHDDLKTTEERRSPKRLDFYRSIGDDFNAFGECLSNEGKMSRHAYDKKMPSESTALTSNFESKEATDKMTRKCFRIKDLKLILSDRFLHLRIKNPAPLIKDVYTHLSHLVEKKDTKASIKINLDKGNFGPATNDKGITVLPIQQSCSCQCLDDTMIQGRGTRMRRKKESKSPTSHITHCTIENTHNNLKATKGICSCATQYRYIGVDKACNSMCVMKQEKERTPQSPHNKTPSSDISLYSSLSLTSQTDDTKTSTTICSRLEVDYIEEKPRRTAVRRVKKVKVNVATKTNQATTTDKTQICDVSTITDDWWSPLVERKPMKFHDEAGDHRYRTRKSRGVATDKRIVKFLSRAQIIPRDTCDILSPSRYLLESQKYYNELFSSRLFTPHLFPSIVKKTKQYRNYDVPKRSLHRAHKMKRLDESTRKGTKHALEKSHSDETPRSRVQAKVKSSKKNRA